ncbi:MAG: hypothetical protein ABI472_18450 [Ginsengibacter sp.]
MNLKAIPFGSRHFAEKKQRLLTSLMVVALLKACEKQSTKIPAGTSSAKVSLTTLIAKDLIKVNEVTMRGKKEFQWQVTNKAVPILNKMGFHISY